VLRCVDPWRAERKRPEGRGEVCRAEDCTWESAHERGEEGSVRAWQEPVKKDSVPAVSRRKRGDGRGGLGLAQRRGEGRGAFRMSGGPAARMGDEAGGTW
jgi:hypothetical protein